MLKRHLNTCAMYPSGWERLASNKSSWRSIVYNNVKKDSPKPSYTYTCTSVGQVNCSIWVLVIYIYEILYGVAY